MLRQNGYIKLMANLDSDAKKCYDLYSFRGWRVSRLLAKCMKLKSYLLIGGCHDEKRIDRLCKSKSV